MGTRTTRLNQKMIVHNNNAAAVTMYRYVLEGIDVLEAVLSNFYKSSFCDSGLEKP